jgi:hypothetical protein
VLSCDCGETFMSWEAAIEHIQKFRDWIERLSKGLSK